MKIYDSITGNSLTIGILFPTDYTMSNATNINVKIANKTYAHTIINKMVRVELKSIQTNVLYGSKELVISVDDVNFGVRKISLGTILFSENDSNFSNQSVNGGYNLTVQLSITETSITVQDVLYDYVKGDDGVTPHIGLNGNWYIGTVDTGVVARGRNGEDGRGITSISLLTTAGLVKTYRILYTDNTTFDYTVTDGADGTKGISEAPSDGKQYARKNAAWSEVIIDGGGHVIKSETETLPQQPNLKFVNAKVTNEAGNETTVVEVEDEVYVGVDEPTNGQTVWINPNDTAIAEPAISKSTGVLSWSGSAWAWLTDVVRTGVANNFSALQMFSSGIKSDLLTKINGSGLFAKEDGGTIYHTTKWFTPTGTFTSVGTAVTTTGGQLTAAMVGAKIGVGENKRIITAYLTSNTCTVDFAFSQDYSGVVGGNWGVYSKAYQTSDSSNNKVIFYDYTGSIIFRIDLNNWNVFNGNSVFNGTSELNNDFNAKSNFKLSWSIGGAYETKDVGIKRKSDGVLEINNGTAGTYRDLKLRSVILTDNTTAASSINVGSIRYRADANNSYCEMCMQTGAATYNWTVIKQNNW